MNKKPIEEILRELSVPAPGDGARERALHRSQIALGQRSGRDDQRSRRPTFWLWASAAGAAVVALAIALIPGKQSPVDSGLAAQRQVLREAESLFPKQLRAVIERGDDLRFDLAAQAGEASDQPLIVTFERDGRTVRVMSYSGRKICLDLNGAPVCFEMLLTAGGEVIVMGDSFLWTRRDPALVAGHRVSAIPLTSS